MSLLCQLKQLSGCLLYKAIEVYQHVRSEHHEQEESEEVTIFDTGWDS